MPSNAAELVQLSYLAWLEQQDTDRYAKYATFRAYYEGDHSTQLTARMRKFLELQADADFSLNFCPIVVDSLAEKLKVAGFECEGQADTFREWWRKNRMDAMQGVVHTAAIRDGDTYMLVEWDNDRGYPRLTQENAYDGSQGVHVVYSDERRNQPIVAIKKWIVTSGLGITTRRANMYYPDRIEKYVSTDKDWAQYIEETGQYAGQWPIPWGTESEPLGIPVIHWRNKDQGYSYGESELEDVVPITNGGNKAFIGVLAAADTTGFQLLYATGVPSGTTFALAPGSVLTSTDSASGFGAIPAADLTGLIELKDSICADIAKVTRTPLSYFQLTGQIAAAGTLKEQRSGLISKALDRQTTFGNAWEDVMYFARKLNNYFGPGGMNEEEEISCVWRDDEKPDGKELAEEVALLTQAQAASTITKVRVLHPDWDEIAVADEVGLILSEQGMNVPDIGPIA